MELQWNRRSKWKRRSKGIFSKFSASRKNVQIDIRRIPKEVVALNFSQWLKDNEKSNLEIEIKSKEVNKTVYFFVTSDEWKSWSSGNEIDEITLQNVLDGTVHEFYKLKESMALCDIRRKIVENPSFTKETIYIIDSSGQVKRWPNFNDDDEVTLQSVLCKGEFDYNYNMTFKNSSFISELKRKSGWEIFTYSYEDQYYHLIVPDKVQKSFSCEKNKLTVENPRFLTVSSNYEERLKLDTEEKLARYLVD